MVQLERLQYLVSTRVHVADVLVGESRWLQGSWIIQGDALIGVDMSKAEIKNREREGTDCVIVLPQPTVISARVNHEKSQQWDIKSRSWIPMASTLLGDGKPWRSRRCSRPSGSSSAWPVRRTTSRRPVGVWRECSASSIGAWTGKSRSSGSSEPYGDRATNYHTRAVRSQRECRMVQGMLAEATVRPWLSPHFISNRQRRTSW